MTISIPGNFTGGTLASALSSRLQNNTLQFGPQGGNAQDGSYARSNSTAQFVGDGSGTTLGNVYPDLSTANNTYPFASNLSQTIDYCAVQAGLNFIGTFDHGTLTVAPGLYKMGNPNQGVLVFPAVSGEGQVNLLGSNPSRLWPGYGATTLLDWSTSADATGVPHFTYAIDTTPTSRATVRGIALKGPSVFAFNSGRLPCVLAGIRAASRSIIEKVSIENFSTGVGMGGGTTAGFANTRGFDHSSIRELWTNSVGYAIHLLPGSNSAGDQRFYDLEVNAQCASIAIAASASSGLVGSNITGAGFYGPVGVYLYDDDTHAGAQILGNTWENASFETAINGSVYCQRLQNPGGGVFAKNHMAYFFQGPHSALNGWASPTFTVASSTFGGGTPNQVTVTDNNGVEWAVGMQVSGPTGIAAAATVTAINGNTTRAAIMGAWPYNNPTITLSANLTADPTGTALTIVQPKLGNVVAFSIHDNVAPTFSQGYSPYTAYWVPATGTIKDNTCLDVNQALVAAKAAPLTSGPTFGTTWGQPGGTAWLGSGTLASGVSCAAGDMLMPDAAGLKLVLADTTRPAVGAAVLATSAGGNPEFYKLSSSPNFASVNNSSTGTIAANASIKVDAAHPGKVTTATGPGDVGYCGYNGSSPISVSTSGAVSYLKC